MKLKTDNTTLVKVLKERDIYIKSIEEQDLKDFDDDELIIYYKWKEQYNKLNQLEKDLVYLDSQFTRAEISKMYGVSRSYITQMMKQIEMKMK